MNQDWICYEDKDIYDGWCLMYRPSDGKIIWRDYVVRLRKLTDEDKRRIEKDVRKNSTSG